MSETSVLITGGAGFIGSSLAHLLVAGGHRVGVFDSLHPQVHAPGSRTRPLPRDVHFLTGDVTSAGNWETVIRRWGVPDVVVHLAAETGTGQSLTEASRHALVNVVGTSQLLDAFTRAGQKPRHVVIASSRAVYGEGAWIADDGTIFYPGPRTHAALAAGIWDPVPLGGGGARPLASRAGTTVPNPSNIYAATKLAQEHLLTAWGASFDIPISILRLQNVYGPGQSLTNSYTGIVALFSRRASSGEVIDVFEDGEIIRDFVFVDDVASALRAAIVKPPSARRILDVGSGAATTIRELAERISTHRGAPAPRVSGRFRDGDVRAASCDIGPAQVELDWTPRSGLDEGLDALLRWIDEAQRD